LVHATVGIRAGGRRAGAHGFPGSHGPGSGTAERKRVNVRLMAWLSYAGHVGAGAAYPWQTTEPLVMARRGQPGPALKLRGRGETAPTSPCAWRPTLEAARPQGTLRGEATPQSPWAKVNPGSCARGGNGAGGGAVAWVPRSRR